ncbi:MAG: M1 family metallopeptidase [Pseudomonadota bacterium]
MNTNPIKTLTLLLTLLLTACSERTADDPNPTTPSVSLELPAIARTDVHSYSLPKVHTVEHLDLDLNIDFDRKVLEGVATLTLATPADSDLPLVLDTRDLDIASIRIPADDACDAVAFRVLDADEILGSALLIDIPSGAQTIAISYKTSPAATGVQWLEPRQTAGGKLPFMFTQAQAIHARSFAPLQDTPAVRQTVSATLRVPSELRALMGADNNPERTEDGVYEFTMPQPIPSYLLAIAAGDLEFQSMGPRTGVYAEAELLDAAANEFADTERMLEIGESDYGPYRWDRYDLLILPPSFPFGGMENPRLSFITPTVIAGDRSLVALIAHELAHSWSGNLVTNASWKDLWLNEGFTTYLTNRIMQKVYGDRRYEMEMALGYADLAESLRTLPVANQPLSYDVTGTDPDAVFSDIPYEKGSLMLYEIEQRIGREAFDAFLIHYFDHFAFKSLDDEAFLAYLDSTLIADHPEVLSRERLEQWIYQPGIPEGAPQPTSDAFEIIDRLRADWLTGALPAAKIDTAAWTFHEWKHFLDGMPETLTLTQLSELDTAFGLTASNNNEVLFSWLMITIRNRYEPAEPRVEEFLVRVGRNKFIRPLYRALVARDDIEQAQTIFERAKSGYHPLSVKLNSAVVYPDG